MSQEPSADRFDGITIFTTNASPTAPALSEKSPYLAPGGLHAIGRDGSPSRPSSENPTTTLLYWHLGRRLLSENLQEGRAEYGKQILATMSRELTTEFGGGFGYATINRAIQLSQCFPDLEIVSTLSTQLSWSHFMELLTPIDALPLQQIK